MAPPLHWDSPPRPSVGRARIRLSRPSARARKSIGVILFADVQARRRPVLDGGGVTAFRWLTAGESHGPQLTIIIEGLPAGLEISQARIREDLKPRQGGHGRGGRQQIEVAGAGLGRG